MATNIVQSLFGVSPESYQQEQSAMADQRALQYAKLDPFQQANYGIGRGAYGLAGAIGGALGGQDPELQKISARNSIAKQIDFSDLNSISQGVRMLSESGDTQGAMQLQQILLDQQAKLASIGKDVSAGKASLAQATRERVQASPKEVQLAREVALLTGFEEGTPQYNTAYATSLQEQMAKPETSIYSPIDPSKYTPASLVAFDASGKRSDLVAITPKEPKETKTEIQKLQEYADTLTPGSPALAQVQARIKSLGESGGTKVEVKNVMPGDKALVDIPAFRSKVQGTIEPQLKTINATDQALQAIEDSLSTGNFASYRAAQVQFARAISGAGDLNQRELKAAGADPSLLGGTADYLSSLFTSTPTTDTQNKIRTTLEAIRKVAAKKSSTEVEQQRKIALRSPGYNPEAVTEALTFPELAPRVVAPIYATNPNTKERIMSTDNGKTWSSVR